MIDKALNSNSLKEKLQRTHNSSLLACYPYNMSRDKIGGGGGMSSIFIYIFIYLMSELNHIILTEQTTQTG